MVENLVPCCQGVFNHLKVNQRVILSLFLCDSYFQVKKCFKKKEREMFPHLKKKNTQSF